MDFIVPYRVATDPFREEVLKAFDDVLTSGMFVLGDRTRDFEESFASSHGRKFGIAVNSDTAALEMALLLSAKKKDMDVSDLIVLMPDTSFYGCANVALRMGAEVAAVPSTISNGIMPTVGQVSEAISTFSDVHRKRLVYLAVYTAGTVGLDSLETIDWLTSLGIPVIEDCAHCHGATYTDGRLVGSAGPISTFSFYATKMIHSGEGGMLLVDDDDSDEFLRTYRNYGKDSSDLADPVFADSLILGYNWRMTEFQAALGAILWKHYKQIWMGRRKVELAYEGHYGSFQDPGASVIWRLGVDGARGTKLSPNLYRYIVIVDWMDTVEKNYQVYERMKERGIGLQAKCNSKPLSKMAVFQEHKNFSIFPDKLGSPTDAEGYCMKHLCLPIYPTLTVDEAEYVAESLTEVADGIR